jgi:DNA-binding transcriptional MerR regulator
MSEGGSPFNDGKAPDALRTIGEVSRALDIRQHVLRYWEEQFPMLRPLKRSGGRRYYRADDIALIETIDRLLRTEGFTLKGARKALEEGPALDTVIHRAEPAEQPAGASAVSDSTLARLSSIRERLAAALAVA